MNAALQSQTRLPIFDRYGGIRALRHVIMDFYDRVLDSDVIGHFFEDTDMIKLIDHQTKFLAMVMGGPAHFPDHRLAHAHRNLRLDHAQFDEIVTLLGETLDETRFEPEDRAAVIAAIEARRGLIVG